MYNEEQKAIDENIKYQLDDIGFYPKNLHNQLKICYAYEYFSVNLVKEGNSLLEEIPQSYYKKDLKKEISVDSSYKTIVKQLVKIIDKQDKYFSLFEKSIA